MRPPQNVAISLSVCATLIPSPTQPKGNATFKVQVELGSIGDGFTANEFDIFCDDPESGKCHFDTLLEYSQATILQHIALGSADNARSPAANDRPVEASRP